MQKITSSENRALFVCTGLLVLFGAYLLFEIEPLAGKIITPLLGGTSTVWVICLLFFQLVVLGGYLLTYLLSKLTRRTQIIAYAALFALSLFWARVPAAEAWGFSYKADPTWLLLASLVSHLSIPCIILSSISGTMQVWQAASGSANPYKLYSLSNLGSLGALLMYPLVIEPELTVSATLRIWAWVYFALFAVSLIAAILVWRTIARAEHQLESSNRGEGKTEPDEKLTKGQIIRWLALSTLGSAGLLAFSGYITTDVAPVPLLWVLPLAIYLATFIVAFAHPDLNTDLLVQAWVPMVIGELVCMCFSPMAVLLVNLILLFQLCMVTNVELAQSKPHARSLAAFYLALAVGGALGGILVALVAPLCFNFAAERSVVILIFTIYQLFAGQTGLSKRRLAIRIGLAVCLGSALAIWLIFPTADIVHRERNFFGSVSIKHEDDMLTLYHGRVKHGQQYIDPRKAEIDVYPYGPPAALVFAFLHNVHGKEPIKVGVIGLGAGSMAIEARKGDEVSYFEIDPKIVAIAQHWFTYLAHSHAHVSIQTGDGRLLLNDSRQVFDGICIDAFSGDAIPVHLLSQEAIKIYLQHLKPDGVLFFHITNAYLDIAPVIGNAAASLHLTGCELIYDKNVRYVVVSQDPATMRAFITFAQREGIHFSNTSVTELPVRPDLRVWTDDYSNLFGIWKWHS